MSAQDTPAPAPLTGVRVIEIDNWMAAPSAGAILADLGATVVKVEPLGGDPARGLARPPKIEDEVLKKYDFQFDVDNRGKQSIAVALDTDEGQAVVHQLCRDADIFMCNLLPRRQERFGLDAETLFGVNEKLVHATLTGYGTDGPDAWRPGYDVTAFFGRSGVYDGMREGADGLVPTNRQASGDHTTGLALSTAILAALRMAEKTGTGQAVETSLFETAIWTQATDFSTTAVDHKPMRKRSRHQQMIVSSNRYPCGDGKWIVINMPLKNGWDQMCPAMGLEHLHTDPRFETMKNRYDNMAELVTILDEVFLTKSRDEWGQIFDEHKVVWGPVQSIDETAADPQAIAIGMFPKIDHPVVGPYPTVRIPMRFHNADVGPQGPSPTLSEHAKSVLSDAGFDAAQIDALIDGGAVGAPESASD